MSLRENRGKKVRVSQKNVGHRMQAKRGLGGALGPSTVRDERL